jgi:hypothetical protein
MNNTTFNQNFFASQSKQMTQIQQLIKNSNDALQCGPTCQKLKKREELKQKYINAQTNVISAPDQLRQAQKNYFLYSFGAAQYDDVISEQLNSKSAKIASTMQQEFDQNVDNADNLIATYETSDNQSEYMIDLKNKYIKENAALTMKIKNITTDIVTNDRKTYYQEQNMDRVDGWFHLYIAVYIILFAILGICIFIANSKYSFKVKLFIFILFLLYPFVSKYIIILIVGVFENVSELFPKNIYKNL